MLCTEHRENLFKISPINFWQAFLPCSGTFYSYVCNLSIMISNYYLGCFRKIFVNLLMIHCRLQGIIEFLLERLPIFAFIMCKQPWMPISSLLCCFTYLSIILGVFSPAILLYSL